MSSSVAIVIVAVVLGTTGPSPASAQNSGPSHAALLVDYVGQTVRVTDAAGTKSKGTLIAVREDEFDVVIDAVARSVRFDSVRRVERRGDNVRDGFGRGALIGAAASMFGSPHPLFIALGAFNWGWIGGLIDALHRGWTPVYVRDETRPVPRH